MHHGHYLGALLGLFALSTADPVTYKVEDIKKYSASATSTPSLPGNSIEIAGTGNDDDGVDIYLSENLQKDIKKAVDDNCKEVNNKCYEKVSDVIHGPDTRLKSRQAGVIMLGALGGLLALLFPLWYEGDKTVPAPIHLEPEVIKTASELATATEIVAIPPSDGPTITIKPPSEPTSVTGDSAPAVTTFPSDKDGHHKGDVLITLPEDMARRMDDYMRMVGADCPAGESFGKGKLRKRLEGYGSVICGAETLIAASGPGGLFSDLLHVQANFQLPWTAGDAVRAMNAVMAFARDQAPVLQVGADDATQLGQIAFAVAWEIFINNKKLAEENIIPAKDLKGKTTESECSTKTADDCDVGCTVVGRIAECETTCSTTKGCKATGTIETTTTVPWTAVGYIEATPTATPTPKCDMDDPSRIPYNVFSGTYGKFCDDLDENESMSYTVDMEGNKKVHKRDETGLLKRTPPPNPDAYKDYSAYLKFERKKDGGSCSLSCKDAFSTISKSPCGHTAGQQNIMAKKAEVDVECGKYSYIINIPKELEPDPPSLGDRTCHGADDFGDHSDIDPDWQNQYTGWACAGTARKESVMNEHSDPIVWETKTNGAPYHYSVKWKSGCKTTEKEQSPWQPLKDNSDVTCTSLLRQNYKKCFNGGVGGYIDAGCLRYEFKAEYEKDK